MKRAATAILAALCSALIAGCSALTMKSGNSEQAWAARRAQLLQIDRFTLQARVSSGGTLGVKGNLNWRQQGENFDMRVAGPFGVGATNIAGRGRQVEIRSAKEVFTTEDPEADIQQRLGWSFPVSHLRYWVLGTPAPGSRAEFELDQAGHIASLGQDGWELEYEEYRDADRLTLPRKFTVSNTHVHIKVVVDGWEIDSSLRSG